MSDEPVIPDYKQALESLLFYVSDQAKTHPDPEQRELANKVFADFVLAAIMNLGEKRRDR